MANDAGDLGFEILISIVILISMYCVYFYNCFLMKLKIIVKIIYNSDNNIAVANNDDDDNDNFSVLLY